MGIAIILRLLVLPLFPGDDLIRYQWKEKIQSSGFNTYLIALADSQLDASSLIIAPALAALIMLAAQRKASATAT